MKGGEHKCNKLVSLLPLILMLGSILSSNIYTRK